MDQATLESMVMCVEVRRGRLVEWEVFFLCREGARKELRQLSENS